MTPHSILRDLGDNLIIRSAEAADAEALAEFNSQIHTEEPGQPDLRIGAWTKDLLTKPHPTFSPADFTIVEDTATGKIVSSLNLISQTWAYAGIPFKVGRPELVGTLAEYRNRGLVRAQFEIIHRWSAERGELVQAITGIPYYYRLFGYEMGLNLGGGRAGYLPTIPELAKDTEEPFTFRPAQPADLAFIAETDRYGSQRSLISCLRSEAEWLYELEGKSRENVNRNEIRVIENKAQEPVGFIVHSSKRWSRMMSVLWYELKPGVSWADVTPGVIRYLRQTGLVTPPEYGNDEFGMFGFMLGEMHPVYDVIPDRLPRIRPPYAWYVRVPDLPAFFWQIAPALESRLANSNISGYSGEIRLTFYRSGVQLKFEQGKLTLAAPYKPTPFGHSGDAAFPDQTFLHLLFGHRSLDELKYAFADCSTENEDVSVLLNTLFPRFPSRVWPIS